MRPLRFNVIANEAHSRAAWLDLARRVEDLGFDTLLTADHLGQPSALARLVAAADATGTLRVGTRVLTNDFFHPLRLAQQVSTVDTLTDGRFELGVGTGWAREEYETLGVTFGTRAERARRLADSLAEMKEAWALSAAVGGSCGGPAGLVPPPLQRPHPPVMIGGQGDAVLAVAAIHADIVGFTGARMVSGQFSPARVSVEDLAERIGRLRAAAGERFDGIELGLRVMTVMMDRPAGEAATVLGAISGLPASVIAASPYAFLGSATEVADKLLAIRERLGITSYDVQASAIEDVVPVISALAG